MLSHTSIDIFVLNLCVILSKGRHHDYKTEFHENLFSKWATRPLPAYGNIKLILPVFLPCQLGRALKIRLWGKFP